MTGWKTKTAGFASIAWGIGGYFLGLHDINEAANNVVAGLGILGIGHKLDKANQ